MHPVKQIENRRVKALRDHSLEPALKSARGHLEEGGDVAKSAHGDLKSALT
jgi:hypothetical protein